MYLKRKPSEISGDKENAGTEGDKENAGTEIFDDNDFTEHSHSSSAHK